MYNDLGFDLLSTLKEAAATGVREAKRSLLQRGGEAIAATPEGQQAIRQSALDQASTKIQKVLSGPVPQPVLIGVAVLAAWWLFRRRGR